MEINIIYEDEEVLVIDKPAGLACQTSDVTQPTLLSELKASGIHPLYLIHRIDQPVSGLALLGKRSKIQAKIQKLWQDPKSMKKYIAIVEGKLDRKKDKLNHFLKKKGNKSFVHPQGKVSSLEYEVIIELDHYSVLSVSISTGRFHQIRTQLSAIGHPIKGDVKYGSRRGNRDRSVHLHACELTIPGYSKFIAPIPEKDNLWRIVKSKMNRETS